MPCRRSSATRRRKWSARPAPGIRRLRTAGRVPPLACPSLPSRSATHLHRDWPRMGPKRSPRSRETPPPTRRKSCQQCWLMSKTGPDPDEAPKRAHRCLRQDLRAPLPQQHRELWANHTKPRGQRTKGVEAAPFLFRLSHGPSPWNRSHALSSGFRSGSRISDRGGHAEFHSPVGSGYLEFHPWHRSHLSTATVTMALAAQENQPSPFIRLG